MLKLLEGMLLYHGSSVEVREPDLAMCKSGRDFGRGFYLTSSQAQAEDFARLVTKRARNRDELPADRRFGWVSTFTLDNLGGLSVLRFNDADASWLECVVAHRRADGIPSDAARYADYDVIAGKVANDQTNSAIAFYLSEGAGPVGSPTAVQFCLNLLMPERLNDQICMKTEAALGRLRFEKGEKAWL